jgi:hypothetical protein
VRLIELARNAQRLFEKQDSREKRRLLNFLVSNSSWRGGELTVTLRQPFDLIAKTTAIDIKKRPLETSPAAFLVFGSGGRTRTCDIAVNSRSLYQLSYAGSGFLLDHQTIATAATFFARPFAVTAVEARTGIEPVYTALQAAA